MSAIHRLPFLIKLIDVKDNLSIQVHQNNEYAKKYENDNGKTEFWNVVDREEGAELYYGLLANSGESIFEGKAELIMIVVGEET